MLKTERTESTFTAGREWQYRLDAIRAQAARVLAQDGSPLAADERQALYGRLCRRPLYILGSSTGYARDFIRFARRRFDLRAVVDDFAVGPSIEGVPRLRGDEFAAKARGAVAVCAAFSQQGLEYFERLARTAGAELVHYMPAVDAIDNYPRDHILGQLARETATNIDRLLSSLSLFADSSSIHTLLSILSARLTYERTWLEAVNIGQRTMYFGVDCMRFGTEESLVDCGAFDGDTIESFRTATADHFKEITAFEPDPYNFEILHRRYASDPRIRLHSLAVSSQIGRLSFLAGLGSFSGGIGHDYLSRQPRVTVNAAPLDSVLNTRPTVIKFDIEGAESEALLGARETIAAHRPKLAIAAYHRPMHIAELPCLIASFTSGYRFSLRHHGSFFLETVLYCVPE
ncbi:MAG TPA: FkbM family methyltransferase [Candidatus Acidoferrum sp.]|nr:FkbM family methyltransferase [Candidatus Acidoferrum sp.]